MAEKKQFNRRDFLKIVGASTGVAAAGCAQELPEKLIPYVVAPDEIIPGVATWYSSTCEECSAGCGVLVRTREGRAVKVEGNPRHPINKGGLCARGQSSVQGLYDPDRIREPLKRDVNGAFKPISWEAAIKEIGTAVALAVSTNKKVALVTKPFTGSTDAILEELSGKLPETFYRVSYDGGRAAVENLHSADSFGQEYELEYDFQRADVIVSFGANYLENWGRPAAQIRGFAKRRVPGPSGKLSKVFHVEPRLSLTAGNADHWYRNAPGTEERLLQALLQELSSGKNAVNSTAKGSVAFLTAESKGDSLLENTGLAQKQITKIAQSLREAGNSLVLAGGAASRGEGGRRVSALVNAINLLLGNIGETVIFHARGGKADRAPERSILELADSLQKEERDTSVVFLSAVNPVYSLPSDSGIRAGLAKAGLVVAHGTHLNETTRMAQIVLPASTSFESWNDHEPLPGIFSLGQPSMQPLYKTLGLGDLILSIAASSELKEQNTNLGDFQNFREYIKDRWKQRVGAENFEKRWLDFVEFGGSWEKRKPAAESVSYAATASLKEKVGRARPVSAGITSLQLLAFETVQFAEGGFANRPWLQEIPDPMSSVVWGSWLEIHPETAKSQNISHGDTVSVSTEHGSVTSPVYITKHIHPNLVALPLGLGHRGLGRYASGVGVNPVELLAASDEGSAELLKPDVQIAKSISRTKLVEVQGYDKQVHSGTIRAISAKEFEEKVNERKGNPDAADPFYLEREEHLPGKSPSRDEVASVKMHHDDEDRHDEHAQDSERNLHSIDEAAAHGEPHAVEEHSEGHHDPHALGPRERPKQMYKQMTHPLYRWAMTVDLAKCTGCSACVTACYAENNVPVVGKDLVDQGREMAWLQIQRYFQDDEESPVAGFAPMMCQHCNNAPCEPVCPVYATYHNEEGLNMMVYNRCVGTRYCSNNCSYKVRRFNWFDYQWPEPLNWQLNPDVTVRSLGVMEKCTFCVQRIREGTNTAKDLGRPVRDGEISPACASSCPADAIHFGNLLDKDSEVREQVQSPRSYRVLDFELNTQPAVTYLATVSEEVSKKGGH